jgi:hypothetical protein
MVHKKGAGKASRSVNLLKKEVFESQEAAVDFYLSLLH